MVCQAVLFPFLCLTCLLHLPPYVDLFLSVCYSTEMGNCPICVFYMWFFHFYFSEGFLFFPFASFLLVLRFSPISDWRFGENTGPCPLAQLLSSLWILAWFSSLPVVFFWFCCETPMCRTRQCACIKLPIPKDSQASLQTAVTHCPASCFCCWSIGFVKASAQAAYSRST